MTDHTAFIPLDGDWPSLWSPHTLVGLTTPELVHPQQRVLCQLRMASSKQSNRKFRAESMQDAY